MNKVAEQKDSVPDKKSLFEYFTEIIGWLQIVASPFLISLVIGAVIYFSKPDATRLIIASIIVIFGLIIGIIWATRVWRRKGTIHFMSRIITTPVLEKIDEEKK
jgi:hypothetical protein